MHLQSIPGFHVSTEQVVVGLEWLLTPTVQEEVSRDLLHIHSIQWDNTSAHQFLSY